MSRTTVHGLSPGPATPENNIRLKLDIYVRINCNDKTFSTNGNYLGSYQLKILTEGFT